MKLPNIETIKENLVNDLLNLESQPNCELVCEQIEQVYQAVFDLLAQAQKLE